MNNQINNYRNMYWHVIKEQHNCLPISTKNDNGSRQNGSIYSIQGFRMPVRPHKKCELRFVFKD